MLVRFLLATSSFDTVLNMSKSPKRWTEKEDNILRQEALKQLRESAGLKDWHRIAQKLPGRSNKDCRKRWCNNITGGLNKGSWEDDEDRRLEAGIRKHGQQWAIVAQDVKTRSADQCAKRWCHCLNPALDRSTWTDEEDQILLDAVEKRGRAWKYIQTSCFPARPTNNVKNRYTILKRRESTQRNSYKVPEFYDYSRISSPKDEGSETSHTLDQKSVAPFDFTTINPSMIHMPSSLEFALPQQGLNRQCTNSTVEVPLTGASPSTSQVNYLHFDPSADYDSTEADIAMSKLDPSAFDQSFLDISTKDLSGTETHPMSATPTAHISFPPYFTTENGMAYAYSSSDYLSQHSPWLESSNQSPRTTPYSASSTSSPKPPPSPPSSAILLGQFDSSAHAPHIWRF